MDWRSLTQVTYIAHAHAGNIVAFRMQNFMIHMYLVTIY